MPIKVPCQDGPWSSVLLRPQEPVWRGHLGGLSAGRRLRAATQDGPLWLSSHLTAWSGLCYRRKSLVGGEVTEPAGAGVGRSREVRAPFARGSRCAWIPAAALRGDCGGGPGEESPEWAAEGPGQPLSWCLRVSGQRWRSLSCLSTTDGPWLSKPWWACAFSMCFQPLGPIL